MAVLHIKPFPEGLQRAARREALEANITLRQLVIQAVEREVSRLRQERKQRGQDEDHDPS